MAKDFAEKFYGSRAWKACREEYRKKQHGLCESCLSKGIFKPGVIVHHIIELTPSNIDNPEVTLNHDNLKLLCRECHDEAHGMELGWRAVNAKRKAQKLSERRYIIDENGKVLTK